jgi:opacity protein-like surface antigen
VRKTVLLAAAVALFASAAWADVVDLTGGSRRRNESNFGWSVRLEAGNSFSPYGFFGASVGYLTDSLFAIEGGLGTSLPGVQFGLAARRLFGEGGSYLATELSIAGNTKIARGHQSGGIPEPTKTDEYIWTSLGAGFEQRTGRITLGFIASMAFTPADANVHFGIHGGIGLLF